MNFNKVFLAGRITRDPELSYTPSNTPVVNFGIACNRTFSQNDSTKEEVTFVDVKMFGKRAEIIHQYFAKGKPIFIEGRLNLDQWESSDGQKRSRLNVIAENFTFVGKKSD